MIESEIHWGDSFENVLSFAHPQLLDDRRTWRRPVPGSARTRNSAGTTDSWAAARDFLMAARARHFSAAEWPRLQAFLDHAGEGAPFRFVPDSRYPAFYVDNCILEEPFDNPEPSWEQSDDAQSVDLVLRQQAFDFNWALRGVLFEYVPGKKPLSEIGGTFARADAATCATQQGKDGNFRAVAANEIRDGHYINGVQHFLREEERQNLALNSSNFVGGGSWLGDTSFTLAAAPSCIEGQTAYRHTDDGGGNRSRSQTLGTFAGGGQSDVVYCIVENVNADRCEISLFDNTATSHIHYGRITFATESFSTIIGSGNGGVVKLGNGRYLLWVSGVGGTAGNTRRIIIYPSGATANTNTVIVHHGQLEPNAAFPTSPIVTAGVALTRAADVLEFDAAALDVSIALTALADIVQLGVSVNGRIWQLSGANDTGPRLLVYRPSNFSTFHQNASGGSSVSSQLSSFPAFGDRAELRSTFAANGAVQTHQSVNIGAEASAAVSAALAPAAAWGSTGASKLYIGSTGTPNLYGSFALRAIRFMVGSDRSLAEIRAA